MKPAQGNSCIHTQINIFERPIKRIRRTCELLGLADDFERKLPQLETHLESLVADGETNEQSLAASGLAFIKQA